MTPSGHTVGEELISKDDDEDGQWEDFTCQGSFEDFIRSLETVLREWGAGDVDIVRPVDTTSAGAGAGAGAGSFPSSSPPPSSTSYSRCLEHDGQLFSIQVVPPPDREASFAEHSTAKESGGKNYSNSSAGDKHDAPAAFDGAVIPPRATSKADSEAAKNRSASEACALEDRLLDFAVGSGEASITPLHRWFGLKQFVLLRALGEGDSGGMGADQLLWAMIVAAGNCKSSVPVLVSCDWDGLVDEDETGIGDGGDGDGVQSGASCKGYSAPGGKGVACSVRFQTAWTDKPPRECHYLDGLTELFISKIRDANCVPGRAFAPAVSTSVQKSWEWTKPASREAPMPAPGVPWEGESLSGSSGSWEENLHRDWAVSTVETTAMAVGELPVKTGNNVALNRTEYMASPVEGNSGGSAAAAAGAAAIESCVVTRTRRDAVDKLLRSVDGRNEAGGVVVPLWGPNEDPLLSLCVRVRWTGLRDGLVEESQHYTTLEPLPEEIRGGGGRAGGSGSGARWFVQPRWRRQCRAADASTTDDIAGGSAANSPVSHQHQQKGRLGDACSRLLAALVLTTMMHPSTLMADLGAGPLKDDPTALAGEYGKAASDNLSTDTREAVEEMSSKGKSPSINHDEIDAILRHLWRSQGEAQDDIEQEEIEGSSPAEGRLALRHGGKGGLNMDDHEKAHAQQPPGSSLSSSSQWRIIYPDGKSGRKPSSEWMQVYPRVEGAVAQVAENAGKQQPHQSAATTTTTTTTTSPLLASPEGRLKRDGGGRAWGPWSKVSVSSGRGVGADELRMKGEERSLWAWAERGGAPVGRLLSLLAMRVAQCDDLGSMSLLWMSFVRDVRLLWEDGSPIPRMQPVPEVDGISMFDPSISGTGQGRSVASQLRGSLQHGDANSGRSRGMCGSEQDDKLRSQPLYPDTRMCLIWQKLQMLNCCRAEVVSRVEALQPSVPPGGVRHEVEDDGEEDEEDFFDTREYYQTSDDEECTNAAGWSGQGGGRKGVVDGGGVEDCLDNCGDKRGDGLVGGDSAGKLAGGTVVVPSPGRAPEEGDSSATFDGAPVPPMACETSSGDCTLEDNDDYPVRDDAATRNSAKAHSEGGMVSGRCDPGRGGDAPGDVGRRRQRKDEDSAAAETLENQSSSRTETTRTVPRNEEPQSLLPAPAATESGAAAPSSKKTVVQEAIAAPLPPEARTAPAEGGDETSPSSGPCEPSELGRNAAVPLPVEGVPQSDPDDGTPDTRIAHRKQQMGDKEGEEEEEGESQGLGTTAPCAEEPMAVPTPVVHDKPTLGVDGAVNCNDIDDSTLGETRPPSPTRLAEERKPTVAIESLDTVSAASLVLPANDRASPAALREELRSVTKNETPSMGGASDRQSFYVDAMPTLVVIEGTAPAAVVADGDSLPQSMPSMSRLLRTGATMRLPRLQESGPVTGDMLEQETLGQASAHRGREVLLADMKAFRQANSGENNCGGGDGISDGDRGGAVFADFVRWYRPECWQSTKTSEVWTRASKSRAGGSAEDDKRLAWPDQGQIVWKPPSTVQQTAVPPSRLSGEASPSAFSLAGWLSCWERSRAMSSEDREEAVEAGHALLLKSSLFNGVKEGEKALHFLETISPGPLLVQLLSAVLGLSVFILEEACRRAGDLPGVQTSVEDARKKVVEAVELLASSSTGTTSLSDGMSCSEAEWESRADGARTEGGISGSDSVQSGACVGGNSSGGCGGIKEQVGGAGGNGGSSSNRSNGPNMSVDGVTSSDDVGMEETTEADSMSSPRCRAALVSADVACAAVRKAETALARAVSLQRSFPGQKELVSAIIVAGSGAEGEMGETPVTARPHKEFLRDLLLAQGIHKAPGSELEDLLASFDEEARGGRLKDGGSVEDSGGGVMPPPQTKEYVLRCQTPAPFYSRNLGRGQMDAYPTPPSRMYAKTDGKNLRVALSLCESEI